jgi:hypothetical protein
MTIALVLLTCLVCPLVEVFDHWDYTVQTGSDTEYTLVVLALCIGVAYAFARLVRKLHLLKSASRLLSNLWADKRLSSRGAASLAVILIPTSPPARALRI